MTRRYLHRALTPAATRDAAPRASHAPRPLALTTDAFPARAVGTTPSRLVLQLALEADVDPRSAEKALREGAGSIRGRAGERLALAAETLGIVLPESSTPTDDVA